MGSDLNIALKYTYSHSRAVANDIFFALEGEVTNMCLNFES